MSHLDRALERARRDTEAESSRTAIRRTDLATGRSTCFVSPWDFDLVDVGHAADVEAPAVEKRFAQEVASSDLPGAEVVADGSQAVLFGHVDAAVRQKLVLSPDMDPFVREQYRRLGAALIQASPDQPARVVTVVSARPGEGKTLTSANLALTLSQSYRKRVLLIDVDLRRPTLHQLFGISNEPGLNSVLKSPVDSRITPVQIAPWLSVLPAGNPEADPLSGLTSERIRRFLMDAAIAFDFVILDTPPVGLLPDANLLASMTDLAILVVEAGTTPYELARRAIDSVGRDRIIGVLLNRVEDCITDEARDYGHYLRSFSTQ